MKLTLDSLLLHLLFVGYVSLILLDVSVALDFFSLWDVAELLAHLIDSFTTSYVLYSFKPNHSAAMLSPGLGMIAIEDVNVPTMAKYLE